MSESGLDFTVAIGGAAGQGIATPGNILARLFGRRGLRGAGRDVRRWRTVARGHHEHGERGTLQRPAVTC